MTLLSPARDLSVAKAAIQAGADAVYIGAPRFGARQAAGNSLDDLQALVRYAHTYGVQVLVTLNTLLREEEYAEAVEMAWALYHIGIDALIIQDLRLLTFRLPPIRLHASTQCDNRTAEQVIRLQELGFRRVVLARELSISEIRAIRDALLVHSEAHGQTPIELEAFVHGALCVSYSGRCYMSEVLTGRSANRGACSQMCRMQYDLLDADMQELTDDQGKPIHQRYLLSLQDMDRSAHLQELIDAGVTTFKIEGRLKDADYVTNITAYYRQKLDALPTLNSQLSSLNAKLSTLNYSFSPNPAKTFHRGGIDYFLHGRTAHMANWETPKSTGEYIGQVAAIRNGKIRLALQDGIALHNGDGLCFGDQGFSVNGVEGDWILPNALPKDLRAGDKVFRNLDTAFVKSLRCERRIPVDILFAETDDGFRLRIGDAEKQFAYAHEPAKNPERALQTLREQLTKLGDTPYAVRRLTLDTPPYFIPISVLNAWRREVVEHKQQAPQDPPRPSLQREGVEDPPRPSLQREGEEDPPHPSLQREGEEDPPHPSLQREGVRLVSVVEGNSSTLPLCRGSRRGSEGTGWVIGYGDALNDLPLLPAPRDGALPQDSPAPQRAPLPPPAQRHHPPPPLRLPTLRDADNEQ